MQVCTHAHFLCCWKNAGPKIARILKRETCGNSTRRMSPADSRQGIDHQSNLSKYQNFATQWSWRPQSCCMIGLLQKIFVNARNADRVHECFNSSLGAYDVLNSSLNSVMWTVSLWFDLKNLNGDTKHEIVFQFQVLNFQVFNFWVLHFRVLHFHAPGFRWSVIFMPCCRS